MFVEKLLGLVDLRGQVWTTATIGVVDEHELTVLLAHLVLVQSTFPRTWMSVDPARISIFYGESSGDTYGSSRIREASRRVIRVSNPLFRWSVKCNSLKMMIQPTPCRKPSQRHSNRPGNGGRRPDQRGPGRVSHVQKKTTKPSIPERQPRRRQDQQQESMPCR